MNNVKASYPIFRTTMTSGPEAGKIVAEGNANASRRTVKTKKADGDRITPQGRAVLMESEAWAMIPGSPSEGSV